MDFDYVALPGEGARAWPGLRAPLRLAALLLGGLLALWATSKATLLQAALEQLQHNADEQQPATQTMASALQRIPHANTHALQQIPHALQQIPHALQHNTHALQQIPQIPHAPLQKMPQALQQRTQTAQAARVHAADAAQQAATPTQLPHDTHDELLTKSKEKTEPFTPLLGQNRVLVRPGPSTAGLGPPLFPGPSCLFVYGIIKTKLEKNGHLTRAKSHDARCYGAKYGSKVVQATGQRLAVPTGVAEDFVKGRLICWPKGSMFEEKLHAADALNDFDPAEPDKNAVRRSVVFAVKWDGSSKKAHWYYQSPNSTLLATVMNLPSAGSDVIDLDLTPTQPAAAVGDEHALSHDSQQPEATEPPGPGVTGPEAEEFDRKLIKVADRFPTGLSCSQFAIAYGIEYSGESLARTARNLGWTSWMDAVRTLHNNKRLFVYYQPPYRNKKGEWCISYSRDRAYCDAGPEPHFLPPSEAEHAALPPASSADLPSLPSSVPSALAAAPKPGALVVTTRHATPHAYTNEVTVPIAHSDGKVVELHVTTTSEDATCERVLQQMLAAVKSPAPAAEVSWAKLKLAASASSNFSQAPLLSEPLPPPLTTLPVVGFDLEWYPEIVKNMYNPTALVQIATLSHVLLFHVHRASKGIPESLAALLGSSSILKVAPGIKDDSKRLWRDFNVSIRGLLDANDVVKGNKYVLPDWLEAAKKDNSFELNIGNWERKTLTRQQIVYAATDAWLPLQLIYQAYQQHVTQLVQGGPVDLKKEGGAAGRIPAWLAALVQGGKPSPGKLSRTAAPPPKKKLGDIISIKKSSTTSTPSAATTPEENYKGLLQERMMQSDDKGHIITPEYRTVREDGPDHLKHFEVEVWLGQQRAGVGKGASLRQAQQRAAQAAWEAMHREETGDLAERAKHEWQQLLSGHDAESTLAPSSSSAATGAVASTSTTAPAKASATATTSLPATTSTAETTTRAAKTTSAAAEVKSTAAPVDVTRSVVSSTTSTAAATQSTTPSTSTAAAAVTYSTTSTATTTTTAAGPTLRVFKDTYVRPRNFDNYDMPNVLAMLPNGQVVEQDMSLKVPAPHAEPYYLDQRARYERQVAVIREAESDRDCDTPGRVLLRDVDPSDPERLRDYSEKVIAGVVKDYLQIDDDDRRPEVYGNYERSPSRSKVVRRFIKGSSKVGLDGARVRSPLQRLRRPPPERMAGRPDSRTGEEQGDGKGEEVRAEGAESGEDEYMIPEDHYNDWNYPELDDRARDQDAPGEVDPYRGNTVVIDSILPNYARHDENYDRHSGNTVIIDDRAPNYATVSSTPRPVKRTAAEGGHKVIYHTPSKPAKVVRKGVPMVFPPEDDEDDFYAGWEDLTELDGLPADRADRPEDEDERNERDERDERGSRAGQGGEQEQQQQEQQQQGEWEEEEEDTDMDQVWSEHDTVTGDLAHVTPAPKHVVYDKGKDSDVKHVYNDDDESFEGPDVGF